MAAPELQKQLQDHARQLALLSQQLQSMENLLKHHDEPFLLRKSDDEPRLVASPARSTGLFMEHKVTGKNQDVTPASCSTDLEIAQARWEALVQMIELEEQSRTRDVAELRMLIEQSRQDPTVTKTAACSCAGWRQEMAARLSAQEVQTSHLQAAMAAPERTYKGILDELQNTRDEATTALRRMSSKLMADFEMKLEALKSLLTTVPGQNPEKMQEVRIQGHGTQLQGTYVGRRAVSRERTQTAQDSITASARTLQTATPPSATISKQAYAHCGQGTQPAGKKAHSIQVPVPDGDGRLVPQAIPKKQNQTSNIAMPPVASCCMDGSCSSCAGRSTLGSCGLVSKATEAKSIFVDPSRIPLATAPAPQTTTSRMMWSPQISCRAVNRTPVPGSPIFPSREMTFAVKPPSPPSRMRNISPAAFTRPLQEPDVYIGTPVVAFPRQ